MSDEGNALRRQVLLNPQCNTVRLVYADWLEENGHPQHAAFIRLQIVASTEENESKAFFLDSEDRICLKSGFSGEKHPNLKGYDRGFLFEFVGTGEEFLAQAEELFNKHPITNVKLIGAIDEAYDYHNDTTRYSVRPRWLWNHIHRSESEHYVNEQISRYCVNYGRRLAGLPELSWKFIGPEVGWEEIRSPVAE